MKILITGGKGMLGRELRRRLSEHTVQEADLPDWDITDSEGIFSKIEAFAPDAVIHCDDESGRLRDEQRPCLSHQ